MVVKFRSTSGLPLATRALASRSIVPPTSYSTGMPVFAVKALPITLSTVSFQLPPHTLMTSAFCARAGGTSGSVSSASSSVTTRRERMAFPLEIRADWLQGLHSVRPREGCQGGRLVDTSGTVL